MAAQTSVSRRPMASLLVFLYFRHGSVGLCRRGNGPVCSPPSPWRPPSACWLGMGHSRGHGHEHVPENLRCLLCRLCFPVPSPRPRRGRVGAGCRCQENVFEGATVPLSPFLLPLYLQCPTRYHPLVLVTRWLGKKGFRGLIPNIQRHTLRKKR
ncbi:hypothetical protein B0T16DRAFT_25337 [Cercophora newfieldiana]|uniref:Secreted protein n=1 Tax=Cercophora newfieldiana TaxID=92897 RepID=A0AA39YQ76_9PEZI|nr:hypothetical protein B0T16DRAFT_25337 [Cercophora newfieldiana]